MDNKEAIKNIKELKKWKYLGDRKYMVALDKAIASLEVWDKVIEDLENLSENVKDEVGGSKFTVNFIIKMIKEYMENY